MGESDVEDDDVVDKVSPDIQVDERGYPLGSQVLGGGGARVHATANPLQLKLEQQKKEAAEKAEKAKKKAALAGRMSAFQKSDSSGSIPTPVPTPVPTVIVESPTTTSSATSPSLLSKPLDSSTLDSRVVGMMKSASQIE